jgi:hypothetical protein
MIDLPLNEPTGAEKVSRVSMAVLRATRTTKIPNTVQPTPAATIAAAASPLREGATLPRRSS